MKKTLKICLYAATLLATGVAVAGSSEVNLLQQRVKLLQSAFQPHTTNGVVKMFAEAVTARNGAVQYMLFCPDLQKKYLSEYQQMNWVSGTSSPTPVSYQINNQSDDTFTVSYVMVAQGKPIGNMVDTMKLHVENVDESARFCIYSYSRQQ